MPWQECNPMDERLKFVAALLDGEKMAALCRRFGVSRKTGYKILERYNSCGLEGLTDRSRRPYRHANQLPVQIETLIVRSKQERPYWGAPTRLTKSGPGPLPEECCGRRFRRGRRRAPLGCLGAALSLSFNLKRPRCFVRRCASRCGRSAATPNALRRSQRTTS